MSLPKKVFVFGGFTLLITLVLMLAVTGVGPYDFPAASRSLPDVIAISQSLGLPMTEDEVEEPVEDDQNAALVVVPLAEALDEIVDADLRDRAVSRLLREESLNEIRSIVDDGANLLDAIQAALDHRSGWFIDKDLEHGPNLLYPEVGHVQRACDVLRCRAYVRAIDGDVDGALRDLATCRKLAQYQGSQFGFIGLLAAVNIEGRTLMASTLLAHLWQADETALRSLRDMLADTYVPIDPRPAMRHEFFNGVAVARNLDRYGGLKVVLTIGSESHGKPFVFDSIGLQREGLPKRMWERAFLARFAEVLNAGYTPIKDDPHPPLDWTKPMVDELFQLDFDQELSSRYAFIMVPVLSQLDRRMAAVDARQALARAYVVALIHKANHGQLPLGLEELDGDYLDPFNGAPLKFKHTADGFRIWSVDADGHDDDGVFRWEAPGRDHDLVGTFPPLPEEPPAP